MLAKLIYAIRTVFRAFRNILRRMKHAPEYVLFTLDGSYPELPVPPAPWWQRFFTKSPLSLQELGDRLRQVAHDPRVKGVVLHLRPLAMSMAQLQTLRGFISELKAKGKRVVGWSYSYDTANYFVACAADEILMQHDGLISPLGLKFNYYFLSEALERVGLKFDAVQITPFKSAPDIFIRKNMSDEARQMSNWLADSLYGDFVQGVAEGRKMSEAEAKALVDKSPYIDLKAIQAHAIDGLLSEEELPEHLGSDGAAAKISSWESAKRRLRLQPLKRPGKYITLLRIEGDIVDGKSQRPPIKPPVLIPFLTRERAGDLSVVQDARRVLRDKRAAALVVYVDSGGGSATASEAMSAALRQVAKIKPVIICMGPVAGSGGYYVATPGQWIIAQPTTITGSIGVVWGKLITSGLLSKLSFNKEIISRGEHIKLLDTSRPYTDEERTWVRDFIERVYDVFLDRVCQSRKMTRDAVDAISGGRVWTGRQALQNGLIDQLGGLQEAFAKARELASLDEKTAIHEVSIRKGNLPPIAQPTAILDYAISGVRIFNSANALLISTLTPEE
ncbi:signal peptide peptidase SppA [Candidatus Acetothermia bacterium]|nr:signal peptide peptidase SppA [Candidatus Acetothermia bacterium]MBI3643010.1 signal peptide peptidase SppA [Candidatus Acetothermia bacterium]